MTRGEIAREIQYNPCLHLRYTYVTTTETYISNTPLVVEVRIFIVPKDIDSMLLIPCVNLLPSLGKENRVLGGLGSVRIELVIVDRFIDCLNTQPVTSLTTTNDYYSTLDTSLTPS